MDHRNNWNRIADEFYEDGKLFLRDVTRLILGYFLVLCWVHYGPLPYFAAMMSTGERELAESMEGLSRDAGILLDSLGAIVSNQAVHHLPPVVSSIDMGNSNRASRWPPDWWKYNFIVDRQQVRDEICTALLEEDYPPNDFSLYETHQTTCEVVSNMILRPWFSPESPEPYFAEGPNEWRGTGYEHRYLAGEVHTIADTIVRGFIEASTTALETRDSSNVDMFGSWNRAEHLLYKFASGIRQIFSPGLIDSERMTLKGALRKNWMKSANGTSYRLLTLLLRDAEMGMELFEMLGKLVSSRVAEVSAAEKPHNTHQQTRLKLANYMLWSLAEARPWEENFLHGLIDLRQNLSSVDVALINVIQSAERVMEATVGAAQSAMVFQVSFHFEANRRINNAMSRIVSTTAKTINAMGLLKKEAHDRMERTGLAKEECQYNKYFSFYGDFENIHTYEL